MATLRAQKSLNVTFLCGNHYHNNEKEATIWVRGHLVAKLAKLANLLATWYTYQCLELWYITLSAANK